MEIISHRRNTIEELAATPTSQGVEVDIRSQGDRLVIHHDPFTEGLGFEEWLEHYRHGTLVLNVKEEGLEQRLIALMAGKGLEHWFFLDQSFPFLLRTARSGERRCAVRVSEYESVETALAVAGLVDWVWVDCFTRFPLSAPDGRRLADAGLKLCLVSPELQGRNAEQEIPSLRAEAEGLGVGIAAVCTKRADLWS